MIALDKVSAPTRLPHPAVYIIYLTTLRHCLGSGGWVVASENGLGMTEEERASAIVLGWPDRVGRELGEMRMSG